MPDQLRLPTPLPWNGRAGAMLYLPGSGIEAVANLRTLLTQLARVAHVAETIPWPAPDSATPVREVLHTLGPCGLYRTIGRNTVELTEEALVWLDNDDPEYLGGILHSRIKFFGELLSLVAAKPMSHEELRVTAREQYGCDWTSLDPLRRRTTWLRSLGFADLSFDNSIHATERGAQFLTKIVLETPESIAKRLFQDDPAKVEIPEPGPSIQALVTGTNSEVLRKRKLALSYIPKSPKGFAIDGLRSLVQHFIPKSSRKDYRHFCGSMFGISDSSADAALTTLRALSLVEPISRTELSATPVAKEWLASNTDLDLIRIAHCNVSFFGEILQEIEDHPTAPALANIAHMEYGMPRTDTSGMRTRLQLLRESGLLIELDHSRHRLTSLGKAFLKTIPTSEPTIEERTTKNDREPAETPAPTRQDVEVIAEALINTSTDTRDPLSFEIAVADAFQALGIDVNRLGGSGDTDVLLKFVIDPLTVKHVIIEAKTSTKAVTEDAVSFEAINDHKQQHGAEYAAIVAPRFSGDRLQRWARDREVALLEASYLSDLILRHSTAPLPPSDLLQLFTPDGSRVIDKLQSEADHQRKTIASVLSAVHAELRNPDPEFNGSLSHREVYMALRHGPIPITSQEVWEALNFLSSPIVHSIGNNKDHFHALERPTVTASRLRAIADAIEDSGFDPA